MYAAGGSAFPALAVFCGWPARIKNRFALSKNLAFTGMRDRAQRKGFYTGLASASGEDTGMAADVRNSGASVVAVHAQHDRAIRNQRS